MTARKHRNYALTNKRFFSEEFYESIVPIDQGNIYQLENYKLDEDDIQFLTNLMKSGRGNPANFKMLSDENIIGSYETTIPYPYLSGFLSTLGSILLPGVGGAIGGAIEGIASGQNVGQALGGAASSLVGGIPGVGGLIQQGLGAVTGALGGGAKPGAAAPSGIAGGGGLGMGQTRPTMTPEQYIQYQKEHPIPPNNDYKGTGFNVTDPIEMKIIDWIKEKRPELPARHNAITYAISQYRNKKPWKDIFTFSITDPGYAKYNLDSNEFLEYLKKFIPQEQIQTTPGITQTIPVKTATGQIAQAKVIPSVLGQTATQVSSQPIQTETLKKYNDLLSQSLQMVKAL